MIVRKKLNNLPNKNFVIHFDKEKEEYYGVEVEKFSLPERIYGDYMEDIERYLNSFKLLNKNLGILLSGHKGAGKTIMAKQFMIESKLPVLIIEEPFHGTKFNDFINSITQEVIVFFDEFDKVYEDQKIQEDLLTVFDGVISSKKVFLLTANRDNINEFFENRPSRIKYWKKFGTIDRTMLTEITEDLLKDKSQEEDIIDFVDTLGECGKDLIISLIEEVNITGDEPLECVKRMNIKIPKSRYDFVALLSSGEKFQGTYRTHPLSQESIKFDQWWDGFEYEQYVTAMKVEKYEGEIHLEDTRKNRFKFYKQKDFDAIENMEK